MDPNNNKTLAETIYYGMDEILREPVALILELKANGQDPTKMGLLGIDSSSLDGLFGSMAKVAVKYRKYDLPVPDYFKRWRDMANRCSQICNRAAIEYGSLCSEQHDVIDKSIRDAWCYMGALFNLWPDRDGTVAVEPRIITRFDTATYFIKTDKTKDELSIIYSRLVSGGFIDSSKEDFLNAFDPESTIQGKIKWIWKDKRRKEVSKRQILDFIAQIGEGRIGEIITPHLYNKIIPAIFRLKVGRDIVSNFVKGWNQNKFCDTHDAISKLIVS